jgi:hypothetical protein
MHGIGMCPFPGHNGQKFPCTKDVCEFWDEYEENCAIVVLVKLLRNEFK